MSDERDDLSGDLATVTDEEWLQAHARLVADLDADPNVPAHLVDDVAAFVWNPALDGRDLIDADEHDEAPRDEENDRG